MKSRILMQVVFSTALLLGASAGAQAADPIEGLGLVQHPWRHGETGGRHRVEVFTFVGPNGDAHVYEPTPADAKELSEIENPVHQRPRP